MTFRQSVNVAKSVVQVGGLSCTFRMQLSTVSHETIVEAILHVEVTHETADVGLLVIWASESQ